MQQANTQQVAQAEPMTGAELITASLTPTQREQLQAQFRLYMTMDMELNRFAEERPLLMTFLRSIRGGDYTGALALLGD